MSDRTDERVTTIQQAHSKALDAISSFHAPAGALLHWGDVMDDALASLAADAAETQTLREQVRRQDAWIAAYERSGVSEVFAMAASFCEQVERERDDAKAERDAAVAEAKVFEETADFWEAQTSASNAKWTEAVADRDRLALGLEDLLAWAERYRGGDQTLHLEEWNICRDYARMALRQHAAALAGREGKREGSDA